MIELNGEVDNDIGLSLIIATRDRCQQLSRCLQSMREITSERTWELIIADNGSVDETAAVIRKFIDSTPIPTLCVFEPKSGKSNALNSAIKIARGPILAFTDDDCYPAPDFVTRVCSAFENSSIGFITGRVILHDPTDHPMALNEFPIPQTFPPNSFLTCGAPIIGANMAFRRKVLLDIGGFDPLFGPGSSFGAAEDLDVASRASAMGYKGKYHPDAVVRHHHGRSKSDGRRLMKSYGIGMGAYHAKLLLKRREFGWFARSVYQIPRRYKMSRRMLLWEPVGGAKYACSWLATRLRRWPARSF